MSPTKPRTYRKPTPPTGDFRRTLKRLADDFGQKEVAGAIGIDQGHLSRLINGVKRPDLITLGRVHRAFPKSFPYLRHLLDDDVRAEVSRKTV